MAQSIILKRSSLPGKVPDTGSLNAGELAINTYDGKIFIKRAGNVDSIQNVLTTDSTTTGSIILTQSGSFGELVVSQDANIQRDLYVIRDIITNNDIDAGGDISGSGLQVNDTLNVTHEYLTFTGSANLTGSVGLLGDLTVLGAVNAQQFNINVISSSIIYQSGSTKFGDTIDDTHEFTGSIDVSGSIIINGVEVGGSANSGSFTGSFTGSFIGDGSGLRGVVSDDLPIDGWDYDSNSSASISDFNVTSSKYIIDFEWDSQIGTPIGHKTFISNKSGSTQVVPTDSGVKFVVGNNVVATIDSNGIQASAPAGTISGSSQLTSSYDSRYVLSGSITQTTWDNIESKPSGIVSGSEQIVGILTSLNSYTSSNETRWTSFFTYSSSTDNRINNLESKSASVDISITNINSYTASNSNNISNLHSYTASVRDAINVNGQGSASVTTIYGNLVVEGTTITVSASNLAVADNMIYLNDGNTITDPDLGIAGNYNDGVYSHAGIFSDASDSHTWKVYKGYTPEPSQSINTEHGSFTLADFQAGTLKGAISATNGVVSGSSQITFGGISSLPTLVSGSSQINVMSTTNIARLATTGSNTFIGNQTITGSLYLSGSNNSSTPLVAFRASGTGTFQRGIQLLNPGMTAGDSIMYSVGQADNSLNMGQFYFTYAGAGSSNNRISLGLHSADHILNVMGTSEVLIGTTTTNSAGKLQVAGNIVPEANGTRDLGSASYRWSTVYTSDLSLNNGIGDWTIVEGEDDLFLYNNKKGKVYKFALTEVDPKDATPKIS